MPSKPAPDVPPKRPGRKIVVSAEPPRRGSKVGGLPGFLHGPPDVHLEAEGLGFLFQATDDLGAMECGARSFLLGGDGAFHAFGRVRDGLPSLDGVRGVSEL